MTSLCLLAAMASPTATPMENRRADWRFGPVVYQVFVDRFAPSRHMILKKDLYKAPRQLMDWADLPKPGVRGENVWTHELQFWGGDLDSFLGKLDYVRDLGADVVYFNPIFDAETNHKYDTRDYRKISPEYGTRADFDSTVKAIHDAGMKVMLDGVFNHVGKSSPWFTGAYADEKDPRRDWFTFDKSLRDGYIGWANVPNLPELKLENSAVRDELWNRDDSVVQSYLREGVDGWRLDVAFELGPTYLRELTEAAHRANPSSAVIGEILGYPADWFPSVDGVFNGHSIDVGRALLEGDVTGSQAGQMLTDLVADAGIENLLRSWIIVDNHDTPRLATRHPDWRHQRALLGLQFTLPGAPCIYYGTELGMLGAGDPHNRAPMRWDLDDGQNKTLDWVSRLIQVRKDLPSLRFGDCRALPTSKLFAFVRTTDRVGEAALVAFNPTGRRVKETVSTRIGRALSWGDTEEVLSGRRSSSVAGLMTLDVAPFGIEIWRVRAEGAEGHSPYKRVDGHDSE